MKENEFPVLKISNVDWDEDHEELEKLPRDFELKWGSKIAWWCGCKFVRRSTWKYWCQHPKFHQIEQSSKYLNL